MLTGLSPVRRHPESIAFDAIIKGVFVIGFCA
jgi:hypothetical protein